MFYVRIKFSHSFHFESKASKSLRQIANDIIEDVKTKTRRITYVLRLFSSVASLFFIFLIIRVVTYRHKFLTKERFDNRFLTRDLAVIDLRRAGMDKETILPLNRRERGRYIRVSTCRLLKNERKQLAEGISLLAVTSLKIGVHMGMDYSLYWIMNLIRKYGKFQSKIPAPNMPTVHIAGSGFLADLLKGVVRSFQPLGVEMEIDTIPCLPTAIPPDLDRYIQIASLLAMCLILTILEPYGLRIRHCILCYYYPKRAKERAVWLYNHIMRSRSSFLKFARRQLRRKLLGDKSISKVTCLEYFRSRTKNKCLLLCLGSDKQVSCLLCAEVFRKSDTEKPVKCQRPGCTAIYCRQCFEDLENVCSVCMSPIEYGDTSDISEEKDSSDEEYTIPSKPTFSTDEYDSGRSSNEDEDNKESDDNDQESDSDDGEDEEESDTDYSYSYQEAEKQPSNLNDFKIKRSIDIEKQHIPDYTSMQIFDDEIEKYESSQRPQESCEYLTPIITNDPSCSLLMDCIREKTSPSSIEETSSAASSFEREKVMYQSSMQSHCNCCRCLSSNWEDPAGHLLLEDIQGQSYSEHSRTNEMQTITEGSEDEMLIQFSSDEENDEINVIYESTSENNIFPSIENIFVETDDRELLTTHDSTSEILLMSDSELSETGAATFMSKQPKKNDKFSKKSSSIVESNENIEINKSISSDKNSSLGPRRELNTFDKTLEELSVGQSDSSLSKIRSNSPSSIAKRLEFIGLQKKQKSSSSSKTDTIKQKPIRKKKKSKIYTSTISTKTSKPNVPSHMKPQKSIIRTNEESSTLSAIKASKEKLIVPKLDLTSVDQATGNTDGSYEDSSEITEISFDKRSKRNNPSTNRRLKAGGNLWNYESAISLVERWRRSQGSNLLSSYSIHSQSKSCSKYEEFSTPTYPFKSELSSESSPVEKSSSNRETPRIDLFSLESSDSSLLLFDAEHHFHQEEKFLNLSSALKSNTDFSTEEISLHNSSMTTDIVTKRSSGSSAEKYYTPLTSQDNNLKRNITILDTIEEKQIESTQKGNEESDDSSDISISIQENILGTPVKKKKKHKKIDQKNDEERLILNKSNSIKKKENVGEGMEDASKANVGSKRSSSSQSSQNHQSIISQTKKSSAENTIFDDENTIKRDSPKKKHNKIDLKNDEESSVFNKTDPIIENENVEEGMENASKTIAGDKQNSGSQSSQNHQSINSQFTKKSSAENTIFDDENTIKRNSSKKKHKQIDLKNDEGSLILSAMDPIIENENVEEGMKDASTTIAGGKQNSGSQSSQNHQNINSQQFTKKSSAENKIFDDESTTKRDSSPENDQQVAPSSANGKNFVLPAERKCNCCHCKENKLSVKPENSSQTRNPFVQREEDIPTQSYPNSCRCSTSTRAPRVEFCHCSSKNYSARPRNKLNTVEYEQRAIPKNCGCIIIKTSPRCADTHQNISRSCNCRKRDVLEQATTHILKSSKTKMKTVGTYCRPQTKNQICATTTSEQDKLVCFCNLDSISSCQEKCSKESLDSDTETYRDRCNLPYQENEEYKRLVQELEEKLVERNRERVKRTMREFERCSANNQNLEKPILYDDSSCGEEPILSKLVHLKSTDRCIRPHVQVNTFTTPCTQTETKGTSTVECMVKYLDPSNDGKLQRYPRFQDCSNPTHWEMDSYTGDWYRVVDIDSCNRLEVQEPEFTHLPPRRRIDRYCRCEECDDLNQRYGHRYRILMCPRHRTDRIVRCRRK